MHKIAKKLIKTHFFIIKYMENSKNIFTFRKFCDIMRVGIEFSYLTNLISGGITHMAIERRKLSMDGNTAAAHVSYAFTEVAAIYPILWQK